MLLLDVNVVLALHRQDHPQHVPVQEWFTGELASQQRFGVPVSVWASFLRLTTNRRIFEVPTPVDEAFAFVDAVRAQPLHIATDPGPRHLVLLREVCEAAEATGDLVPDAVIAAIAVERSCSVASLDRDFARFTTIDHVRPPTH